MSLIRVVTVGLLWGLLLSGCVRSSGGATVAPDALDTLDAQTDQAAGDVFDSRDTAQGDHTLDTSLDQVGDTEEDAGKDLLQDGAQDVADDTADRVAVDPDLVDSGELPDTAVCLPACEAKECGPDGCGGDCGNCPAAAPICTEEGLCKTTCVPQCDGKECGPDYCGSDCGTCADGIACENGICQDGPCLGVTCSGHGTCVDEIIGIVCDCDAGYHAQGIECLEGDFCIEGSFKSTDSTYPAGPAVAQHAFDSLVGVDIDLELCFVIDQRTETSCYNGDFFPCIKTASHVVSAYIDTDNTFIVEYAINIIGELFSTEISEYNGGAWITMSNLIAADGTYPTISVEFGGGEYNNGEPWNSPILEPVFLNNWPVTLRRYSGSTTMTDYSHAIGTLILH